MLAISKKAALLAVLLPLALTSCSNGFGFGAIRPPSVDWKDTSWCVPLSLKIVLNRVSRHFGPVKVHSTHRWPLENARKGGKPRSFHLSCRAVDFSVPGNPDAVLRFLKAQWEVGGYAYYKRGFYHIDNGPRRTW